MTGVFRKILMHGFAKVNLSGGIKQGKMGGHLFRMESIGEVLFERSPRAKRINISVRPFKGVRVAVPYRVSLKKAIEFAGSKRGWIKKNLNKKIGRAHV